jgi:dipeptidyl aminopeptidase/acylaminoacyl peptidase
VQDCKTPTLILHGDSDPIVPVAEAYEFYHALKSLRVETELVIYPREGHNISDRAHQVDFQNRVLTWFDKHLK